MKPNIFIETNNTHTHINKLAIERKHGESELRIYENE